MDVIGALGLGRLFGNRRAYIPFVGYTTYTMATLNKGFAARFTARDTRDVKAILVYWATVTTPGQVTVTVETVDTTTGKPTGSLYDANATLVFTPTAAVQTLTFASLPTTGLVAGTEYCVVFITTTGGTTQTLRAYDSTAAYLPGLPSAVLTAADGTTRSNFAELANSSQPLMAIKYEDDSIETGTWMPYYGNTTYDVYGTRAAGIKFTLPHSVKSCGAYCEYFPASRAASYANLRVTLYDGSNNVIATRTMNKVSLTNALTNGFMCFWNSDVILPVGTYRMVVDQDSHSTTSSDYYRFGKMAPLDASLVPSGIAFTSTSNVDASPITWTDEANTSPYSIGLLVNDIPSLAVTIGGHIVRR